VKTPVFGITKASSLAFNIFQACQLTIAIRAQPTAIKITTVGFSPKVNALKLRARHQQFAR